MTWVVGRFKHPRTERAPGVTLTLYEPEHIEFRRQDQAALYERLRRVGLRALDASKQAEGLWRDHPPV